MRTQDVPLPEGDETDETTNKETEPALEYGWRVRWGRTIGQRQLASGVVLAFEPNTTKAASAFNRRAQEYLKDQDVRLGGPGRSYVGDVRSGKYVEMDWISRPRP